MDLRNTIWCLFKIILFYFIAVYIYQYLFLKFIVWPFIHFMMNTLPLFKGKIEYFIKLDYGRIIGRIAQFLWVGTLFVLYSKYVDKLSIKNTVLFPVTSKSKYFLYGALFGLILICITIALIFLTKSLTLEPISNIFNALFPVIFLYVFAMIMTAFTEEFIIRGYILNNLFKVMNPHSAIFLTAIVFGFWHLQYSALYATEAFLFGIIAGYGFLWTRNLYFCIGLHFGWNFIEAVVYSQSLFHITVYNKFLAGAKNITPDREGILALPPLVIGFFILYMARNFLQASLASNNTKHGIDKPHP